MTKSRFDFITTPLSGLTVVQRKTIEDGRGFFSRFYCADEFRAAGLQKPIVQINHSFTRKKGAVRGLHFQNPPHTEAKVVSCLNGEIFDVAVDLRKGSLTFLCWHGGTLSSCNHKSLLIPEGFAHGFQTLTEDCELIYLHTASYAPDAEGGLNVRDPRLAIKWPLDITELSDRDRAYPGVGDGFEGIRL
ncbi:MAG: dTDP-4-dehydrorhamnose 3,5-epimerase [Planctomycetota bacterium]